MFARVWIAAGSVVMAGLLSCTKFEEDTSATPGTSCPRTCGEGTTVFEDGLSRVPSGWNIEEAAGASIAPDPSEFLSEGGSIKAFAPQNVSSRALIHRRLGVGTGRSCFEVCIKVDPGAGGFGPDLAVSYTLLMELRTGQRELLLAMGRAPFVNRGSKGTSPAILELPTASFPFRRWVHVKIDLDDAARKFDLALDGVPALSDQLEDDMSGREVFVLLGTRTAGEHPEITIRYEDPRLIER
jgi:hypothetical protein